jgi:hypothetical protein
VLRVRVRGDGGGGDGDLHWLSLSFYSIRLSPPGGQPGLRAWARFRPGGGARFVWAVLDPSQALGLVLGLIRPIGTCVHRFRDHVSLGSRCVVSSCVKSVFIDHVLDHVQC